MITGPRMSRKDLVLSEIWGSEDIVGRPSSVLFLSQDAVSRAPRAFGVDALARSEPAALAAARAWRAAGDHYRTLGLQYNAGPKEIKDARASGARAVRAAPTRGRAGS